MSSALFALSVASCNISSRFATSLASASFCFSFANTLGRAILIFCSSWLQVVNACLSFWRFVLTSPMRLPAWPCSGSSCFCTFIMFAGNGWSNCSAESSASMVVLSLSIVLACSTDVMTSAAVVAASSFNFLTFSETAATAVALAATAVALACCSFGTTEKVFRTGPANGIFQPFAGGFSALLWLCDQTSLPPTDFPNHQPSKEGPSLPSQ
mmetsp:Transcript_124826/g.312163  ORF Transcript_124826/g.312163 Transcript_124826/m.312163 type:complete len:211 (-) Transcript_124826:31-663(-)